MIRSMKDRETCDLHLFCYNVHIPETMPQVEGGLKQNVNFSEAIYLVIMKVNPFSSRNVVHVGRPTQLKLTQET